MAIRPIDATLAAAALLPAAPICLLAAAGIWLTDGGPLLYRSRRVGLRGRVFTMYKFRTMRNGLHGAGAITRDGDTRVFAFGGWLRRWKIDELPQLVNVLLGDMAIVGPRPEDPAIVDAYYGPAAWETLNVRPGLASPGSIYHFTHIEGQLRPQHAGQNVDALYAVEQLPRKLALDLVYVRAASLRYDIRIVFRAMQVILARGLGRGTFPDPPEMAQARQLEPLLRVSPVHALQSLHPVQSAHPVHSAGSL